MLTRENREENDDDDDDGDDSDDSSPVAAAAATMIHKPNRKLMYYMHIILYTKFVKLVIYIYILNNVWQLRKNFSLHCISCQIGLGLGRWLADFID